MNSQIVSGLKWIPFGSMLASFVVDSGANKAVSIAEENLDDAKKKLFQYFGEKERNQARDTETLIAASRIFNYDNKNVSSGGYKKHKTNKRKTKNKGKRKSKRKSNKRKHKTNKKKYK